MYIVGKCLLSDKLIEAHMTQQELANRLKSTRQQVNSYTTNRRVMTLSTAYNISLILGCEMSELYEWKVINDK